MNLVIDAPIWLFAILIALIVAAAAEDAWRLRISNFTSLGVVISAVTAMGIAGFPFALWQNLLVFVVLLVIGTMVFAARLLGGGDVKLLAALGLWVNLKASVWLISAIFLAGGLVGLAYILARVTIGTAKARKDRRVPYGIAIAVGAILVFAAQRGVFETQRTPKLPVIKGLQLPKPATRSDSRVGH